MEKISKVLPNRPRLQTAETSEGLPARPGAPTLGLKQGRNSVKDRVSLTGNEATDAHKQEVSYRQMKNLKQAKMVDDVTQRFFAKPKPVSAEIQDSVITPQAETQSLPKAKTSESEFYANAPMTRSFIPNPTTEVADTSEAEAQV
jgi:hypothetical protein